MTSFPRWLWAGVAGVLIVAAAVAVLVGGGGTVKPGQVEIASRVRVGGAALPTLPASGADPAVGEVAPTLTGVTFSGKPLSIGNLGEAHAVVFVAHWCPHCQAEVPRIVALTEADQIRVPVFGVATGTDSAAPNYPPSAWLTRVGWPYPVLVDTAAGTAANAYGLPSYPFLVFVDAQGRVAGRVSGEVAPADLAQIFAALVAARPLPLPGVSGASSTR